MPSGGAVGGASSAVGYSAVGYSATPAPPMQPSSHAPPSAPVSNGAEGLQPKVFIPYPAMAAWNGDWGGDGMRILFGNERKIRATIAEDGEVTDGGGNTLAYIESNGEVGDAQMNYVGVAHLSAHQVVDYTDHVIGEFDPGRGYVKDALGSVVAELTKEGTITDNGGQSIGKIENFSYAHIATLAAYFLLVDPKLVRGQ